MYNSKEQAIDDWIPPDSDVIFNSNDVVVYAHAGELMVLRVFSIGGGFWHVSLDYRKPASDIQQLFPVAA